MGYVLKRKRDVRRVGRAVRGFERRRIRIQAQRSTYPLGVGRSGGGSGAWSLVQRRVICSGGTLTEQWRLATYNPGAGISYTSWTSSAVETPPDE